MYHRCTCIITSVRIWSCVHTYMRVYIYDRVYTQVCECTYIIMIRNIHVPNIHIRVLQCVCRIVLQCVAVCCSVWRCVAVCGSVSFSLRISSLYNHDSKHSRAQRCLFIHRRPVCADMHVYTHICMCIHIIIIRSIHVPRDISYEDHVCVQIWTCTHIYACAYVYSSFEIYICLETSVRT